MQKQLISFAQVIKFLKYIKLKGGFNPNPSPLAYALGSDSHHSSLPWIFSQRLCRLGSSSTRPV